MWVGVTANRQVWPERLIRVSAQPKPSPQRAGAAQARSAALRACRTPDQLVRSQLLYPAELRARDAEYIRHVGWGHCQYDKSMVEKPPPTVLNFSPWDINLSGGKLSEPLSLVVVSISPSNNA